MRSGWQTHKDKRLFFCNYAYLGIEELKAEIDAVDTYIAQQPPASVLMLTDLRGLRGSSLLLDMFKKSASITRRHLLKSAVVGIGFSSGPRKAFLDIVLNFSGTKLTVFEDIEKAKDWLAGDS